MTWLALDTATDRPSFAVGEPRGAREVVVLGHRHDLSAQIDGTVRGMLESRALASRDLAGVAVADGPGSFTGLRIGLAFAKGLCRAAGLPLVTAPSLLAAARRVAPPGGVVCAEYDALRGEVYRAVYRFDPTAVVVLAPPGLAAAHSAVRLPAGAALASERDADAGALLDLVDWPGGAVAVTDPAGFEPDYGRLAEAEARRLAAGRG